MVTKLYLIRHGETEGGQPNRYKGHIDVPLSENGIRQMERLSKYIVQNSSPPHPPLTKLGQEGVKGEQSGLNAIYTSDLSRALKSAEIIAKPHKLKPVIMPELRERNFGIWEGMSFNEIKGKYPQEFEVWVNNPLKFSPMQGESTIEVKNRALKAFNEIFEKHYGENIAMVSHGGINRVVLCHLLEIPFENIFRIEQDYGTLNIVEFYDKYPVVKLLNFTLKA